MKRNQHFIEEEDFLRVCYVNMNEKSNYVHKSNQWINNVYLCSWNEIRFWCVNNHKIRLLFHDVGSKLLVCLKPSGWLPILLNKSNKFYDKREKFLC